MLCPIQKKYYVSKYFANLNQEFLLTQGHSNYRVITRIRKTVTENKSTLKFVFLFKYEM